MTLFRHWKAGSTGLWFPQIKASPMTVPAYSLESFQTMAWGGWWWGGLRVHQSHVQETNQSSRKPNGQAWGRALKKRDPLPSQSCGQGAASLPPSAELHAYEHPHLGPGKGNRKQQAKQPQSWQGRGSLTLLLPAGSGRPLTTQSITSSRVPRNRAKLATDHRLIWISPNKAQNQGVTSSNQLQITFTVEQIQHYTVILRTPNEIQMLDPLNKMAAQYLQGTDKRLPIYFKLPLDYLSYLKQCQYYFEKVVNTM